MAGVVTRASLKHSTPTKYIGKTKRARKVKGTTKGRIRRSK